MKTTLIHQHGTAKVLQPAECPLPVPKTNEVLVKLVAAAVNHVDVWVRQGSPAYPVSLPHIMGADGAGTIAQVGAEAEGVEEGNRVLILPALSCGSCRYCRKSQDNQCEKFEILGTKRAGTYAEFVVVPDENVLLLPDNLSFETAAAFPLSYLTAWHMLIGKTQLKKGETVLVVGASAGISVAAIQIAKALGATVLATTTSPTKMAAIKNLGADHILNTTQEKNVSAWVKNLTDNQGVDVVFEHVGPATWEESLKSVKKYGRLVTCGATTGPAVPLELRSLFARDISLFGARMGTKKEFKELFSWVASGKIQPLIDKTFPLAEAKAAHEYMENRQQVGKIMLRMG